MQSVRQIERLNQTELDKCVPSNASWHTDYRDTAYIYIGGLPFELSEGDILTIFSQYGNPVHINLVRDKDTGKSRGFCFLKYEDQRSCDLAVDNLSGAGVMGRVLSVDHTRYKKKEGEVEGIGDEPQQEDGGDTDKEGSERRKRRKTESESDEERPMIKEEIELAKLLREHNDDDPMKEYLVKEKREEVAEALKKVIKHKSKDKDKDRGHKHRHHHRSRRDADGDREHKSDRHRSRRERDSDDGERGHRSHRSERDDGDEGRRRSRPERSRTPESDVDREHRKRRSRRDDSEVDNDRPSRRERGERPRKEEQREERPASREPYRRR